MLLELFAIPPEFKTNLFPDNVNAPAPALNAIPLKGVSIVRLLNGVVLLVPANCKTSKACGARIFQLEDVLQLLLEPNPVQIIVVGIGDAPSIGIKSVLANIFVLSYILIICIFTC